MEEVRFELTLIELTEKTQFMAGNFNGLMVFCSAFLQIMMVKTGGFDVCVYISVPMVRLREQSSDKDSAVVLNMEAVYQVKIGMEGF